MISSLMALALVALPLLAAGDKKETGRLENCGLIVKEVMDIPDNIPEDLINKAECIIVYPSVLKAAFVIGGSYGRGAMTCRSGEHFTGPWSAPTMMALEGGSVGLQLGGQATDFVLLVMNPRGARAILSNKVKLGADASAAAGPKRSEEHTSELQSRLHLVCRLLLEKKKGRRHAARLPHQGARRRRRLAALRAARRRDLGAGHARDVPLAPHRARLHAVRDEQGSRLAEPRLLAHAAPLVHRARDRHRRAGARPGPGRGAEEELHPRRGHAVRDAERLRLRLGRLRGDARPRARADRLGLDPG